MRQSHKVHVIYNDQGSIDAIHLEAGGCAEHEWGIDRLNDKLGIKGQASRSCFGLDCRTSDKKTKDLGIITVEFKKRMDVIKEMLVSPSGKQVEKSHKRQVPAIALFIKPNYHFDDMMEFVDSYNKTWTHRDELVEKTADFEAYRAYWDQGNFIVLAYGKKAVKKIKTFFENAQENNLSCFLANNMPNNPFSRSGLTLAIYQSVPEEVKNMMASYDVKQMDLDDLVAKTKIVDKLQSAGKRYHALSPALVQDKAKDNTQHEVKFFLNPWEQSKNNFGWFTVEDLELWIENKGPIPKVS